MSPMGNFLSPLKLELIDRTNNGRQIFRLLESFSYEIGQSGSNLKINVPAGFETDFASVPRFFWPLVPPTGIHGKAAVVHDYLYNKMGGVSRIIADAVFLEAMGALGVPWLRKWTMYLAVRFFGWFAYHWSGKYN